MFHITFAILGLVFAILSHGHKSRQGHKDSSNGNMFASILYEMAALVCISVSILCLLNPQI